MNGEVKEAGRKAKEEATRKKKRKLYANVRDKKLRRWTNTDDTGNGNAWQEKEGSVKVSEGESFER